MAKRHLAILRENARRLRDSGASENEIKKYLADNDATLDQVLATPVASPEVLERLLENEKTGEWEKSQEEVERAKKQAERSKERLKYLGKAQGMARSFGDGLLFGFSDELESGLTGQDVEDIRKEQKEFMRENPALAIGSTIAGAVANPVSALGGARGATLGSKMLSGGLTGLGQGAVYGLGSGEGGLENRLKSAGTTGLLSGALGAAIPLAGEIIKKTGKGIAEGLGFTTGTGKSVSQAYQAGKSGDKVLVQNMRGQKQFSEVVDDAINATNNIQKQAYQQYKEAMKNLPDEKISLKSIKNIVADEQSKNVLGKGVVDDTADALLTKISNKLDDFTYGTGDDLLSVKDVDAIKRAIGSIDVPEGSNAERIKTLIYNAVKNEIKESAPIYESIMRDYGDIASKLYEIKKTFSLGGNVNRDTAVRKFQSLMRDGVETNYGNRLSLAKYLEKAGGANLQNAIAGQSLSSVFPRGIVARGLAGATGASAFLDPRFLLTLGAASPRIVGESAYKLGQLSNALSQLPKVNIPAYSIYAAGDVLE